MDRNWQHTAAQTCMHRMAAAKGGMCMAIENVEVGPQTRREHNKTAAIRERWDVRHPHCNFMLLERFNKTREIARDRETQREKEKQRKRERARETTQTSVKWSWRAKISRGKRVEWELRSAQWPLVRGLIESCVLAFFPSFCSFKTPRKRVWKGREKGSETYIYLFFPSFHSCAGSTWRQLFWLAAAPFWLPDNV